MKTQLTFFCLVFGLCIMISTTAKAQVNKKDSLALVDLYYYTNGESWRYRAAWGTGPISEWRGVSLSENHKRVIRIDGDANNASGTLPSSLGDLSRLLTLNLENNGIGGSLPAELGNLSELQSLNLDVNLFSGFIPRELGNLSKLQYLNLDRNQFVGGIPNEFGNLSGLVSFSARVNQLSGSIPQELGNLSNLTYLDLRFNKLRGNIPAEFGKLLNLTSLRLNGNRLSGNIPSELGQLANLQTLLLNNNGLSGSIPSSIANLEKLTSFDLSHNRFTFEGMERVATKFPFAIYGSQKEIPIHRNNNTLSVSAGGTLSNNTYRWFKVGLAGSTKIKGDSTFRPPENGQYYVKVTNAIATQLTLYSDTIDFVMPLAKNQKAFFTANAEYKPASNKFSVYPNPAKDILHIKTKGHASFSLLSQAGELLRTIDINNAGSINISGIAAGVYHLRNNDTKTVEKIFIEK